MGFAFVMLAAPNARGAVPLSTSKLFMLLSKLRRTALSSE